MGNYAALIVALIVGLAPALTLAGTNAVEGWEKTLGLVCSIILLLLFVSVLLVAFGVAPQWMRNAINGLLVPPKEKRPEPEIGIVALLRRIHPLFATGPTDHGDVQIAADQTLRRISDRAALGRLAVFGKRQDNMGKTDTNFTEIPAEFWRDVGIDYMSVISGNNGSAERRIGGSRVERYVELMFDTKQSRDVLGR